MLVVFPFAVSSFTPVFIPKEDGRKIVGQCEISHPVPQEPIPDITVSDPLSPIDGMGEVITSQRQNVMFEPKAKGEYEPLGSRISRVSKYIRPLEHITDLYVGLFYINAYGIEIHPSPNPEYISNLASKDALVYSCGSLWTRRASLLD